MKKYYTFLNEKDVTDNPLDLLNETNDLIIKDDNSIKIKEIYEVEAENLSDKLKLGRKLSLKEFVDICSKYAEENGIESYDKLKLLSARRKIARLVGRKDCDILLANKYRAQLASSGDYSIVLSVSDCSELANNGDLNQLVNNGNFSQLANSGNYSRLASNGEASKLASSGNECSMMSSGKSSEVVSAGNYPRIELNGENSIGMSSGVRGIIKGKKGNWITLTEWESESEYSYDHSILKMVKSAQIGNSEYRDYKGNVLKEDTYYMLINKEFTPIAIIDNWYMVIISNVKDVDGYKIFKTQHLSDFERGDKNYQYIAEKDGYAAHGNTIKEAIEDVNFKRLKDINIDEHIKRIKKQGYMTANDYRLITGACRYGTNRFLEKNNLTWEDKKSVEEVLKLVKGEYGYDKFKKFADRYEELNDTND